MTALEKRLRERVTALLATCQREISPRDRREVALDPSAPSFRWTLEAWPSGVPCPATWGDLLEHFTAHTDQTVQEMAREIEAAAMNLVPVERRERVLERPEIVERWSLPRADTWMGVALGELRRRVKGLDRWSAGGGDVEAALLSELWPPTMTGTEFLQWAEDARRAAFGDGGLLGVLEADAAMARDHLANTLDLYDTSLPGWVGVLDPLIVLPDGSQITLARRDALVIWTVLETLDQITPRRPKQAVVSVERDAVRTMAAIAGGDTRVWSGGGLEYHQEVVRYEFSWNDGSTLQLDLFHGDPGTSITLRAIRDRFGVEAVRDLEILAFFHWVARASAGDPVWFYPHEILEMAGVKDTRENRGRLRAMLDSLCQSTLGTVYRHGPPLRRPVLARVAETGGPEAAERIILHPSLYTGVARERGLGTYWWAFPVELFKVPREARGALILVPLVGSVFRGDLASSKAENRGPKAKMSILGLVQKMGIQGRGKGAGYSDRRAADQLRESADALVQAGVLSRWDVDGDLGNLDGTMTFHAPRTRPALERPVQVPATGDDFDRWLHLQRWTQVKAAEALGVNQATVSRARGYGYRPLPRGVRDALRRYLWEL